MEKEINLPISDCDIENLHAGDIVLLTGTMLTARDAAHKRLFELLKKGEPLPFSMKGETIYYVGPAPSRPGSVIGPCGPTSSYRMDLFTPALLDIGLKAMIGKGARSEEVIKSIIKNKAIYFAAVGGAAALLSRSVVKTETVCYSDLGTEAVCRLTVNRFPCIVAVDCYGTNYYESQSKLYRKV